MKRRSLAIGGSLFVKPTCQTGKPKLLPIVYYMQLYGMV
jgi:hypothetical protein